MTPPPFLGYCPVCSHPVKDMIIPKEEMTTFFNNRMRGSVQYEFYPCGCKSYTYTYTVTNGKLVGGSSTDNDLITKKETK